MSHLARRRKLTDEEAKEALRNLDEHRDKLADHTDWDRQQRAVCSEIAQRFKDLGDVELTQEIIDDVMRKPPAAMREIRRALSREDRILAEIGASGIYDWLVYAKDRRRREIAASEDVPELLAGEPPPAIDIPEETMDKLAKLFLVPEVYKSEFDQKVRRAVAMSRESAKNGNRLAAKKFTVDKGLAEKLSYQLKAVRPNVRDGIEEALQREIGRAPGGRGPAVGVEDAIKILDSIALALSRVTPESKTTRRRGRGRRRGRAPEKAPFQHLVLCVCRAVRWVHGKCSNKPLFKALELIRPFAPDVVPERLMRRTIERLKADSRRWGATERRISEDLYTCLDSLPQYPSLQGDLGDPARAYAEGVSWFLIQVRKQILFFWRDLEESPVVAPLCGKFVADLEQLEPPARPAANDITDSAARFIEEAAKIIRGLTEIAARLLTDLLGPIRGKPVSDQILDLGRGWLDLMR